MSRPDRPQDPLWPRAAAWLTPVAPGKAPKCDLALLGVPAHLTSITPTDAHSTPAAVREALDRYSLWAEGDRDPGVLEAADLGDVRKPDGPRGEARVAEAVALARKAQLLVAVGGDNSITWSVMHALSADGLGDWGLITVDAHHDLRDGVSNGSPVRRLVKAGLPGANVVQLGIAPFSNSPAYARRAREWGITVVPRCDLDGDGAIDRAVVRALAIAGAGGRPVYVDLDVDVCDLAEVPGCPSAAPGGISAHDLRRLARAFAADARVRAMDITEIDAERDAPDQRTARLGALLVLEAAAGLLQRKERT